MERQYENADSPRRETLEPDSNLKSESLWQYVKQLFGIASTEAGMQIEPSDEQCANEDSPSVAILLPVSNLTDETEGHWRNPPVEIATIHFEIVKSPSPPKYLMRCCS
jgi:hypothetical protein